MPLGLCEYCVMRLSTSDADRAPDSLARVVGLTGGMGAGKSTVASILRSLGHDVYDADSAAKSLYERDDTLGNAVRVRFGEDVFDVRGKLNRSVLAERAFSSPEALTALNALVHPAVARDFADWRSGRSAHGAKWVFREAAILFESGSDQDCDRIWVVTAPLELRMMRIYERDGMSTSEIERRMGHQWTQEKLVSSSDSALVNDGLEPLVPRVVQLLDELF